MNCFIQRRQIAHLGAIVAVLALAGRANAVITTLTLSDVNSSVSVDVSDSLNASNTNLGMRDWVVDGVDQMFQQWFWFRVGNSAESPINSLGLTNSSVSDTDFDLGNDVMNLRYSNGTLQIDIRYSLEGGSLLSGNSDIGEQITIKNLSESSLDLHFFQYADFDINGSSGNDVGWYENATNTVDQADIDASLSETVITGTNQPTHHEIALFNSIITSLLDGVATTLNDTPGIYQDTGETIGTIDDPGDVTWAFQWDFTLGAGQSFLISKDKNLVGGSPERGPFVPEPASLAIWGGLSVLGLVFGGRLRRKAA